MIQKLILTFLTFLFITNVFANIDQCTETRGKLAQLDKEIEKNINGCPQDPKRCMKTVDDLRAQKASLQAKYLRDKCKDK